MRFHALQTGTVTVKERQLEGAGPGALRPLTTILDRNWTEPLPILAWLIEHPEGPIVVDTGETARAGEPGWFPSWHPYFRFGVRESVRPDQEIGPALRRLGIDPAGVTVVLTHMHTDHAGGLDHFAGARILVSRTELRLARGLGGRLRGYLPNRWPDWFQPAPFEPAPGAWGPFDAHMPLTSTGDVVILPTPGHTPGHVSVAADTGEKVFFFAGDTSYTEALLRRRAVDGVAPDVGAAKRTIDRILALGGAREVVYLPSHDPDAAARLEGERALQAGAGRSADVAGG